jgi:hypothetical protein
MDANIKHLADLIEKAEVLLSSHGERRWSGWFSKDVSRIRNLDLNGVAHFLSAFGGMGSINDLVLHPMNGHSISEAELDAVNSSFRVILAEAYDLARKLYGENARSKNA